VITSPVITPKITVGVADMKLCRQHHEIVVTHALGSCIGVAIYDPVACVGGILHFMLADSRINPERAAENPWVFADTALPLFFEKAYKIGAVKSRLIIKVAGASQILDENGLFAIGKRNHTMLRKWFWEQGLLIKNEHIGGSSCRTLYLEMGSGRTWISINGHKIEL
jgi:chemotaxis protein CheD